ncbi:DUF1120 domain-containing protein [Burkholderia pyrrocinia]|uniref:DUF1120 domain-containing protein n=1 Tax=Burkholderia pyrrocinia TaxID=60550 RepID=UPI0010443832|nr:DUF1120 domain-containing protein [Burkholderia pyrrocinia]TDA48289.1 DUF1120 domain-containing protein [Burkholderia pyrrocinia]
MNKMLRHAMIGALAFLAATSSVYAQTSTTEVRVIGTITPAACTPVLGGGGVIDYGAIDPEILDPTDFTKLAEKSVPLTITCNAPAKVGLKVTDNRASSLVPNIMKTVASNLIDTYNFGLGTVAGKNVGGYVMRTVQGSFTGDIGDGNPADISVLSTGNGGTSWITPTPGNLGKPYMMSWGINSAGGPVAYQVINGTFTVIAVLNKKSELPLTQTVPLNGSATLELVYL